MHRSMRVTLITLLVALLATATILTGCTAVGDMSGSASLPDSSVQSSSASSSSSTSTNTSVPRSRPASSSSSRPATSSASWEAATSSSTSSEASATISSASQAPASSPPAVQASASSETPAQTPPPATETPAPPPATLEPLPTPSVDIDAVIALGHAYAAERNMAVSSTSPSCLGPIETDIRSTESVLSLLYAQFDVIYAALLEIPEYEPGMVVPCYNLTVSGTTIYLYFG